MPIDKSWIFIKNRLSEEFWNGLQGFIDYAKDFVNEEGKISCPCKHCVNGQMFPLRDVKRHIFECGFDVTYAHWVFHGEPPELPSYQNSIAGNESDDEMAAVLNDIVAETHDHGIGGETTNNTTDEGYSQYEDLLSELHTELYPGCTKVSSLIFLVKLMHLKVLYKWPNECMDSVLKLLKDVLPNGSKLPTSHYESKKKLSKLGLGYQKIHACKYDCVLFWKSNADLQTCPICNTSRWKNERGGGGKVQWKVLRYFPLKDRLRRLFVSRHTSKEMTWHQRGKSTDPDVMHHPVDGKEWK
ncbi:unnamed protein product [Cuscuta europaea]|uniref:Transposase-associated domain-containing protein n=1 Tax=Cuscuta europaea TaxID=41803 RepID=A0A9P1EL47_CUSEU|nr:unnamed protein product [Cuscuta europaea]